MRTPDAGTVPAPAREVAQQLLLAAGYLLAAVAGRATVVDGSALSLVWPAAGVAAVWVTCRDGLWLLVALAGLAAATFGVNVATGAPPALGLVFIVTNLVQALVLRGLLRRWVPEVACFGGDRPLSEVAQLVRVVIAAVLACAAGAALGQLGTALAVEGETGLLPAAAWWSRNSLGTVVVLCVLVLALQAWRSAGTTGAFLRGLVEDPSRPDGAAGALEGLALAVASGAVWVAVFLGPGADAYSFLLLAPVVWAGLRFAPLVVALHGFLTGAAAICFTIAGRGPFVDTADVRSEVVVVQAFVGIAVVTGLALAFARAERDHALRRLHASEREATAHAALLGSVLEQMRDGVVVVDEHHRVVLRNEAAGRILGRRGERPDVVEPAAAYHLVETDGTPVGDEDLPYRRALAGQVAGPRDLRVVAPGVPSGTIVEIGAHPVPPLPGAPRQAMVHVRDVTVERQRHAALASFARVVAHDLLNPLTVVQGWADVVRSGLDAPEPDLARLRGRADRILEAAERMRELVDAVLALALARDRDLRPRMVDLSGLMVEVARLQADSGQPAEITVQPGVRVWGDRALLRQLLENLLTNAVKYAVPGRVPRVALTAEPEPGSEWLEVRVSDEGIGIPTEDRERVFEPFHRVGGATGVDGHGIGLATCAQIVERHHGTIRAEETPGGGTTIVLRLPGGPVEPGSGGTGADTRTPSVGADILPPDRRSGAGSASA
ncbi:MASE1 domain-containing protein [Nocardioides sp. ChNu-153]|uniref:ATP-binding protein n=1 Tax=unclassified Nocardioides TaxID=2615069 RepID=UPI002404D735|nr:MULTISPECIES: ATP-binding protein [unclassified Nocardioides]MDF9714620.1 MASE1 domain-containing protein [Nocardioides sp. ChNu-99]MDN7119846.1 MASE1 domain-containing protein [Nocardioides sp. ChNu-153]